MTRLADTPGNTEKVQANARPERTGGSLLRLFSATALIAVFSGIIPLALVGEVPDVGRSEAWIVTIVILCWSGARLSLLIVAGLPRLFDFFFWLFGYIFLGIAPTVQIRSGLISTTTAGIDEGLDLPTALLVALGFAVYELVWLGWVSRERMLRRREERVAADADADACARAGASAGPGGIAPGPDDGTPDASAILPPSQQRASVTGVDPVRTLLLLAVGVLASGYFLSVVGSGALLGSREAAFAAREAAWPDPAVRPVMYALAIYPLLVAAGALAQLRRRASTASLARWFTAALVASIVVLLLIVNPIGSARYTFGTVAFALAVYAGAMLTPARVRATLAGVVAAFIFVFPLADAFRGDELDLNRNGFFGEYMSNPDYDAFWQIANAFTYWLDGLVVPLNQALGSVLFWVPRAIWPDKPVDTGILLAHYRGYDFENLSAPFWAELLVNGGIIVLVLGFAGLAIALRRMDTLLLPAFGAGGVWAIVGAIFPVYMTILMRGSWLQATGALVVAIGCVLFVAERRRRKRVLAG